MSSLPPPGENNNTKKGSILNFTVPKSRIDVPVSCIDASEIATVKKYSSMPELKLFNVTYDANKINILEAEASKCLIEKLFNVTDKTG